MLFIQLYSAIAFGFAIILAGHICLLVFGDIRVPSVAERGKANSSYPRCCSLEVRQARISTDCCLLRSRNDRPLNAGARRTRIQKLQRQKVLV